MNRVVRDGLSEEVTSQAKILEEPLEGDVLSRARMKNMGLL